MAAPGINVGEDYRIAAEAMERIQRSTLGTHSGWSEISSILQKSVSKGTQGFLGVLTQAIGLQPVLHNVSEAFQAALSPKGAFDMEKALEASKQGLDDYAKAVEEAKAELAKSPKTGIHVDDQFHEQAKNALKAAKEVHTQRVGEHKQLEANLNLQKLMSQQLKGMHGVLIPAVLLGFRDVWKKTWEINKAFKEATTDGWQRYRLLRMSLQVQRETGASTDDVAKSMQALVTHGFDLDNNLGGVAKTVTMMQLGLGVSTEKSADLASSFRNLGQPIDGAANGIARIQRDTALSAESAAKYYTQIARALALLKPGSGGMAAQVGLVVSQFEAASQRVLGRSGDITNLITSMSTMEGRAVSQQLGMEPDFMADPAKVDEALRRLNQLVSDRLAGAGGALNRINVLDQMSKQWNIQKDVLANLSKVVEERNKTVLSQTTLEKAYNEQVNQLGAATSQLTNRLMSLARDAFVPVVLVVSKLIQGLDWLVEKIVSVKGLAVALSVGIFFAGIVATAQMWRLSRALLAVALAGKAAAVQSEMRAAGSLSDMLSWNRTRAMGRLARMRAMSATRAAGSTALRVSATGARLLATQFAPAALKGVFTLSSGVVAPLIAAAAVGIVGGYLLKDVAAESAERGREQLAQAKGLNKVMLAMAVGLNPAHWGYTMGIGKWANVEVPKPSNVLTTNVWEAEKQIVAAAKSGTDTPEETVNKILLAVKSNKSLHGLTLADQVRMQQQTTARITESVAQVYADKEALRTAVRDDNDARIADEQQKALNKLADAEKDKLAFAQSSLAQAKKDYEQQRTLAAQKRLSELTDDFDRRTFLRQK